jgi:hypothetical protein
VATVSSPTAHVGSEAKAHSAVRTIATIALVAGTADLTAACIHAAFFGTGPVRVFHSVASGLLGPKSFQGSAATAVLGVLLHYVIMTCWGTAFYLASRKLRFSGGAMVCLGPGVRDRRAPIHAVRDDPSLADPASAVQSAEFSHRTRHSRCVRGHGHCVHHAQMHALIRPCIQPSYN